MSGKTIALLVPRLYNGGAEKVAADMSIFLSNAGYHIVFFLDQFNLNACYNHKGKEVVIDADPVLNRSCQIEQWYHYLRRAEQYKKYKRKYKVDISISFMVEENLTNVLADIGDKKILTLHSVTSRVKEFRGLLFAKPWVLRKLYPRADAVIAVSKAVKRDLECRIGACTGTVDVIYNSVNAATLHELSKESLEQTYPQSLILYVGRLDHEKRPWIAIRVMQEVVHKNSNVKLVMLGQGENEELLRELIKQFHLESHVELVGFTDNVAKYMAKAKLLVLCSETEAFPCVLTEAAALGLPTVANNCPGGIHEILSSQKRRLGKMQVDNVIVECGVITPMITLEREDCKRHGLSREEKLMAQAICTLLEDDELRKSLSQNALIRSKKFSREEIAEKWLTVLKKMA